LGLRDAQALQQWIGLGQWAQIDQPQRALGGELQQRTPAQIGQASAGCVASELGFKQRGVGAVGQVSRYLIRQTKAA
jgi:hypothetical protein